MGTRNLVAVVMDKKFRIAQYGQFDGYIDGQGKTVIEFIRDMVNNGNVTNFIMALSECRFLTDDEVHNTWIEAGQDPKDTSGMIGMDIAEEHKKLYPALSRDTAAHVLGLVLDGKITKDTWIKKTNKYKKVTKKYKPVRELDDNKEFAEDGMYCEYAYLLNMDKRVLEIYCEGKRQGLLGKMLGAKTIPLWKKIPFDECMEKGLVEKLTKELKQQRKEED